MRITIQEMPGEPIILLTIVGQPTSEELSRSMRDDLMPLAKAQEPTPVYVIIDVREFEWSFQEFIQYIQKARKNRDSSSYPSNLRQLYVGENSWIQGFRTWIHNRFGDESGLFTDINIGINYAREQHRLYLKTKAT